MQCQASLWLLLTGAAGIEADTDRLFDVEYHMSFTCRLVCRGRRDRTPRARNGVMCSETHGYTDTQICLKILYADGMSSAEIKTSLTGDIKGEEPGEKN